MGDFLNQPYLPANSGGGGAAVTDPLALANRNTPSAPVSGVIEFAQSLGGRSMPAFIAPVGDRSFLQPLVARKSIKQVLPQPGNNSLTAIGFLNSNVGTMTARTPATTNLFQSGSRTGFVSAGTGTGVAGLRSALAAPFWLGNAAGLGGFFVCWRFGISDAAIVSTGRTFVGLGSTSAPTDVDPSTLTNIIGVGNNNGDAHLQLYASGSVAQARTDLGANFPANTTKTDVYELILFAQPNATSVTYQLTRLNTGDVATGTISNAANLPSSTTFLSPTMWRSEGGTATATGIDLFNFYSESDL